MSSIEDNNIMTSVDEIIRKKSTIVPTRIVEFTTNRPKFGRRGSPAIPAGTKLFAIQYLNRKGGYFPYSYLNYEDAKKCIEGGRKYSTDNEFYYEWNVIYDIQNTKHCGLLKETGK